MSEDDVDVGAVFGGVVDRLDQQDAVCDLVWLTVRIYAARYVCRLGRIRYLYEGFATLCEGRTQFVEARERCVLF
jgi:hypothetical protein